MRHQADYGLKRDLHVWPGRWNAQLLSFIFFLSIKSSETQKAEVLKVALVSFLRQGLCSSFWKICFR